MLSLGKNQVRVPKHGLNLFGGMLVDQTNFEFDRNLKTLILLFLLLWIVLEMLLHNHIIGIKF